jgi:hypothetical protein
MSKGKCADKFSRSKSEQSKWDGCPMRTVYFSSDIVEPDVLEAMTTLASFAREYKFTKFTTLVVFKNASSMEKKEKNKYVRTNPAVEFVSLEILNGCSRKTSTKKSKRNSRTLAKTSTKRASGNGKTSTKRASKSRNQDADPKIPTKKISIKKASIKRKLTGLKLV